MRRGPYLFVVLVFVFDVVVPSSGPLAEYCRAELMRKLAKSFICMENRSFFHWELWAKSHLHS